MHPGARIANARPGDRRRIFGKSGHAHGPTHRLGHRLEALVPTVRTVGTKAFDAGIDETRVQFFESCVAEPQPIQHSRREVFQQHIGALGQLTEDLFPARALEVEGQAALVGVKEKKEEAIAVRPVAQVDAGDIPSARLLDFNDVRPQPGQHLATRGTGLIVGQVKNSNTCQRATHLSTPLRELGVRSR